ncbi:MAG: hypothetical protein OXC28_07305 [Defluviicoccus sp.]|nr:hypothetical protein [Defluviicoccus sp.]
MDGLGIGIDRPPPPPDGPSIAAIKAAVAEDYGVGVPDLVAPGRSAAVARPRQAAMWLCRRLTAHTAAAIGKHFGDRDHSTVGHACRAVEARLVHPEEYERMQRLLRRLGTGNAVGAGGAVRRDRVKWALHEVRTLQAEIEAVQRRLKRMAAVLETGP